jgi:hypothetical protein
MKYSEMIEGIEDAQKTINAADLIVNKLASIVIRGLRKVSCTNLARLKRELKSFNMNTGEWK